MQEAHERAAEYARAFRGAIAPETMLQQVFEAFAGPDAMMDKKEFAELFAGLDIHISPTRLDMIFKVCAAGPGGARSSHCLNAVCCMGY